MITRPMLAETVGDINTIDYPVLTSPKLDGIRCVIVNGRALTRKFKPIPNHFVRNWLEKWALDGFDGELMVPGKSFNEIQSLIMSEEGKPDFEFHVFDAVQDTLLMPYVQRYAVLSQLIPDLASMNKQYEKRLKLVEHRITVNSEDLLDYESMCDMLGYEGVMIRSMSGHYKCGRSTLKQGWLLKLKKFLDSEALVLGFEELQTNTNIREKNELGLTKRSHKKAGKIGAGVLGKFKVMDIVTGVEFDIGTGDGLTQALRAEIWKNRKQHLGKLIKYKYQPAGQKDKPRFPIWLGFRDERDL